MVDPVTLVQGIGAVKTAFDAFRSAIAGVKDIRSLTEGTPEQNKVVDEALAHAVRTAAIAEAQVAQALGYQLCKCEFPPTIMLTVGYHSGRAGISGQVFECPKCGINTASPFTFTRTAPQRTG
jgi:hypothetical protein